MVFIAIFGVVGVLMQNKMKTLLHYYVGQQAVRQAQLLAQMTEKQFAAEFQQLEWTASYLQYNEADRQEIVGTFSEQDELVSVGLLEMDGNAVCGAALDYLAFSGIRQSFRGENAVSFNVEQGMLFTVPVYRGRNVRYVLYKLYYTEALHERFGMTCYEGRGRAMVMNLQEQVVIPGDGSADEGFLLQPEIRAGLSAMWEQLQVLTATSEYVPDEQEPYFLFSSEITGTDMILVGYVPEETAMEGISYLILLVLWVFTLLMIVLMIGMIYLFGAEERARESDELREAKLMADKANRAKSDFLANMSHEIRTPINAVMGMNEMILRECEQQDIRDYAQNIRSASQTLLTLINDILDFSKIESGKMEIVESSYDVASLINDVVNMVRVKAEDKNLWFHINIEESLPGELWGDAVRNRQVVINLLNNAVKYTKEGGITFGMTGEVVAAGKLMLKVQITDTGIGIQEEDMPKLFRNFERLNLDENRNVEGTGLGLAITYRLVEQMNGRIEVWSKYGEGSVFTVYLPQKIVNDDPLGDFQKRCQTAMKQSCNIYRESFVAPEARILAVDDTAINLLVITQLLKKTQMKIDTCQSGKECLEMIRRESYDVILLDHMMPDQDGIETLQALRGMEDHKCKNVPVIALTANAITGVREMYLEKGFDDYLSKPIEGSDLEDLLRKYIPVHKLQVIANQKTKERSEIGLNAERTGTERQTKQRQEEQTDGGWIDIDMGIQYCGNSEEVYRDVLQEFCEVETEDRQKIERAYADGSWKDYATLIHGLKSASLSAGAKKLSEKTAGLEELARELQKGEGVHREEVLAYISEYHKKAMDMYKLSVEEGKKYL